MKAKNTKTRLQKVNEMILILHIVFPIWIIALMYTSGISGHLFLAAVISAILLCVIYKTVTKLQKGKTVLYVARAIAVLTVISFYIPAFLLMGFSHTKALYRLKRLDYAYGVFGENAEYYKKLLPDRLPEVCEDYSFRTKGNMVAQDYHPSSYLIFRTDAAAIDLYSEHYRTLDCEVMISDGTSDEVKKDIDWVCGQMRLRETFQDDLDHAELYWFSGLYPKAVLLDRRSGLVAILT